MWWNAGVRFGFTAPLVCILGIASGAVLSAPPAHALQFVQVEASPTEILIGVRGPIVDGDVARLEQVLAAVPPLRRLLGLAVDSPGGSVVEGERLATLIRARRLPVVILSNSACVSACFLLLAASPQRMAASDAVVGVHSASENGEETGASLAVTTLMARDAANLGIPPSIIGKMVRTTPGHVEWLTRADLVSMDVTIFDDDTPAAAPLPSPAKPLPVLPALPSTPARPQAIPPAGTPAGMPAGVPIGTGTKYEGAYFCGRQVALVTLTVYPQPDAPRRRALLSFGPQPASQGVPRGAFIVEGEIALNGGMIAVAPVKWVTQPAGYIWLGLSGRSDDGGRTFRGRVTNNTNCTIFTLKRVGELSANR
jgi:hypothetical protein